MRGSDGRRKPVPVRERDVTEETVVLAGLRAGKPLRGIAVDLYGGGQVDANWHADSRMRAKQRRLVRRAEARGGAGPDGAGQTTA